MKILYRIWFLLVLACIPWIALAADNPLAMHVQGPQEVGSVATNQRGVLMAGAGPGNLQTIIQTDAAGNITSTPAAGAINSVQGAQAAGAAITTNPVLTGINDTGGVVRFATSANAVAGTTGTGLLGSGNMVFDTTNWQKMAGDTSGHAQIAGAIAAGAAVSGANPVTIAGGDAANNVSAIRVFGATGDASADSIAGVFTNTHHMMFNGTTWDRERDNVDVTLLASASRTTTQNSGNITVFNERGVNVYLNMTVVGTGNVTVNILGVDPVSGGTYTILQGSAITTNSFNVYRVYPALTAVANSVANDHLPRVIQINITANNANAATYSVGYTLLD